MARFGALLIVLGLLSFVLPLFGRQFVLVSLFGGSTAAGLGFIGAGALLVVIGALASRHK